MDFLIFSKTPKEHVEHLRMFFKIIHRANLRFNLCKSELVIPEVEYLGHTISKLGVQPNPANVKAIVNAPLPPDVKGVRSFLGMCSFFRNFVQNYSTKIVNHNSKKMFFQFLPPKM